MYPILRAIINESTTFLFLHLKMTTTKNRDHFLTQLTSEFLYDLQKYNSQANTPGF